MRENMTKIMKKLAMFAVVLFATAGVLAGAETVHAYVYMSDVTQTAAAKNSITVQWSAVEGVTGYNVYVKDSDYNVENYTFVGTTTNTSYTITGLKGGMKYYVKVYALEGTTESDYDQLSDAITLPDKLTGLKQEKWWFFIKKLDVCWDKQSGADGVEVTLYDNKGKKVKTKTVTGSYSDSTEFDNMKDKVYTVKARSFKTYNGVKYYSEEASVKCLNQARIKSIKVNGKKLTVKWGKIGGATGYNIYVSTQMDKTSKRPKNFKKVATVKAKKSSYTIKKVNKKKISKNKTYYVYIETVCNKGGTKNTSGGLYYWDSKTGGFGYII